MSTASLRIQPFQLMQMNSLFTSKAVAFSLMASTLFFFIYNSTLAAELSVESTISLTQMANRELFPLEKNNSQFSEEVLFFFFNLSIHVLPNCDWNSSCRIYNNKLTRFQFFHPGMGIQSQLRLWNNLGLCWHVTIHAVI